MTSASAPVFDPRPVPVEGREGGWLIEGRRCTRCRYPVVAPLALCPVCGGDTEPARFGPSGTVSASTCLHVRVPGRTPPYAVAYLDLDDGPRVLVHTAGLDPATPGGRLSVGPRNEHGDLTAREQS